MEKNLSLWVTVVALLASAILASQSVAAEFHVTNVIEFKDALNTTENNGEDDVIYLAAGTYEGNFGYSPSETEHKALRRSPTLRAYRPLILTGIQGFLGLLLTSERVKLHRSIQESGRWARKSSSSTPDLAQRKGKSFSKVSVLRF